jgi:predicted NBD/HSP70 family sugar kinase
MTARREGMKVLVIDVGGSHVKIMATGHTEERKFESGPTMTPAQMADGVKALAAGWAYDAVAIGYPGGVVRDQPATEPYNLAPGWVAFDYGAAFGCPVRIINDAAMQALGSYRSGRLLFLGLGTGLGTTLIVDGIVVPMELAHLPYRKASFEDYVGERGLERDGRKKWRKRVFDVAERLKAAFIPDDVVIGGGNLRLLKKLPTGCRAGDNANAFAGGFRLWASGPGAKQASRRAPVRRKATKAKAGTR